MSDVITFLAGIETGARSATKELQLLATTEAAASSAGGAGGAGGGVTSGKTGGSSDGGLGWLGSSVQAEPSMDAGKVLAALKGLGGRT